MGFPDRLRLAVELRGLTDASIAALSGLSAERIAALLAGGHEPAPEELLALCALLETQLTWLGCGVGAPPAAIPGPVESDERAHRIDAIDRLSTHGPIDEEPYIESLLSVHRCDRHAALRMAARHGRHASLKAMIGVDWHVAEGEGGFVVAAAQCGALESLKILGEAGADLCEMDGRALFEAAAGGYGDCVQFLLDTAPLGLADLSEGHLSALSNQRTSVANLILAHSRRIGYDIVAGNEHQIASAATLGSWPSVLGTLESITNLPNIMPALELVALPRAVANGSVEGIDLLVGAGCNPCANHMTAFVTALTVDVPRRVFDKLVAHASSGGHITQESVSDLVAAGHMVEAYLLSPATA